MPEKTQGHLVAMQIMAEAKGGSKLHLVVREFGWLEGSKKCNCLI